MEILIDIGEFGWSLSKIAPFFRYRTEETGIPLYVMGYASRYHIYSDFINGFVELPKRCDNYVQSCMHLDRFGGHELDKLYRIAKKHFRCNNPNFFLPFRMFKRCQRQGWEKSKFIKYKSNPMYTRFVDDLVGLDKKFVVVVPRHRDYGDHYDFIKRRNYGYENWKKLIETLLSLEEFKNYKIVAIGCSETSHFINGLSSRFYDLTQIHVADYSAFAISVFSNAVLSLGTQSGGTILGLHCGTPSYLWGHEEKRHKEEENVHKVPAGFCSTKNYDIEPELLVDKIINFWRKEIK